MAHSGELPIDALLGPIRQDIQELRESLKRIDHLFFGNGQIGFITRLYRLEWAVWAVILMSASSPVAQVLKEVMGR